jgi:hypothetical protein
MWPIGGQQWQRLAAALVRNESARASAASPPAENNAKMQHRSAASPPASGDAPRRQWRLLVQAQDAPGVRALAALLRESLPPGEDLTVAVDSETPAGFANLVPPRQ